MFVSIPKNVTIHKNKNLHLSINQQSFKVNNLNARVNALINYESVSASKFAESIKEKYPLFVTGDLNTVKEWGLLAWAIYNIYAKLSTSGIAYKMKIIDKPFFT